MNHFSVPLTMTSDQAQISDRLKTAGADVIQTAGGLFVKSEKSKTEIEEIVGEANVELITEALLSEETLSPDVRSFLNS